MLKLFLAYADGKHDLIQMAERFECNALDLIPIAKECEKHGLIVPG
ncbi:MAG: winged helix-turn-helix domain-containing protein [Kordiimonas sp.]